MTSTNNSAFDLSEVFNVKGKVSSPPLLLLLMIC